MLSAAQVFDPVCADVDVFDQGAVTLRVWSYYWHSKIYQFNLDQREQWLHGTINPET